MFLKNDYAFAIFINNFNEKSKIVTIFSEKEGIIKTFVKNKEKIQMGDYIKYSIIQKNNNSINILQFDVIKHYLNNIIFDKNHLIYFNKCTEILIKLFKYSENLNNVFLSFKNIMNLFLEDGRNVIYFYFDFLLNILNFFGYKIDLYNNLNNKNDIFISKINGEIVQNIINNNNYFIFPKDFFNFSCTKNELKYILNIFLHFLWNIDENLDI